MLTAAETDLEMERTVSAEKPCGCHLALCRNRDLRQHSIDQILLPRAQRLALRSAVEAVEGGRVAGFMRSHGARVSAARRGRQAPPALSGRERGLELVDEVGALPREGVALGGAAEVAIGCGLPIDRLVEPAMRAAALLRQDNEPRARGLVSAFLHR